MARSAPARAAPAAASGPAAAAAVSPATASPTPGPEAPAAAPPLPRPGPGNLAYVIFTSGSTGEPKGVMIEHRAIVNRLLWMRDHYGFGPADRILQKTPATFDVSVWEFFLAFLSGGVLVVAPPGAHRDPRALARLIRDEAITTLHFVPSMLSAFLAAPDSQGIALARVFCSGEELTPDQRARFHRRVRAGLHNLYGPTEAAVDVSYWPADAQDRSVPLPIGFAVWNTRLEVLDDRFREVPDGVAGQLYLGGVQLARGYLGQPELSAERFIPDPRMPGERLYATGDLARRRPDGAVVYLGRSDHQVKIRGLRIELGEIEAALTAFPGLREAVVLAREAHGSRQLVAYTVPEVEPQALRRHLAARLPDYMLPAAIVGLPALPVTANGKLDRKALPAPVFADASEGALTPDEARLAALYAEVLHLPAPPGPEGDFFALGGDSLSAVQLVLRIEAVFGHAPGLGAVFDRPTVAALARGLRQGGADDGLAPAIRLGSGEGAPLVLVHPAGGIGWGYRALAAALPGRPVWALQSPALDPAGALPESLAALARLYVQRMLALAPAGPWHLAAWSVGGIIAQAMACELQQRGLAPGMVALLDAYPADVWRNEPEPDAARAMRALLAVAGHDPEAHPELTTRATILGFLRQHGGALGALPEPVLDGVIRTVTGLNRLVRRHHHARYHGTLLHVAAALDHRDGGLSPALWHPHATRVETLPVPFRHPELTAAAAVAAYAPALAAAMTAQEQAFAKGTA